MKVPLLALGGLALAASEAPANTLTWNGGSGNWSDATQWSPNAVPQNGDDLVFNNSPDSYMTNDIAGLSVGNITFHHTGSVWGPNQLTVTTSIYASPAEGGVLALNFASMALGGDIYIISNDQTGWGLTLNCITLLQGRNLAASAVNMGSVTFQAAILGPGVATFGSGTNYYANYGLTSGSAPVVVTSGGSLGLDGNAAVAIGSQLEIYPGATAFLLGNSAIANSATVTLYSGAQFLLNGNSATIGSLVLSNYVSDTSPCVVDASGSALLGLNGGITSWNDSGNVVPTIKGRVTLNGFLPFFTGGAAYAGLDLPAALGSGGGFSKAGNSALMLHGASTFTGGVEVDQGILDVGNSNALGATSGVLLYGSGSLTLRTSISGTTLTADGNEHLTPETSGSLLTGLGFGSFTWSGPVVLETNLVVQGGADIAFTGPISGPGGLDVRSGGTVLLGGSSANSFSGTTLARGALLELGKPSNVRALNGPLIVGGGGGTCEVRWLNNYQDVYNAVNTTPSFTLYPNGFINVNNNIEVFGPVTFNGGTLDSGASGLASIAQPVTVNPTNVSAVINGVLGLYGGANAVFVVGKGAVDCDLVVNAVVSGSPTYFVKQGPGTICMTGLNTYNAVTLLEQGMIDINNASGLGTWPGLVIFDGATLRLSGSASVVGGFEAIGAGVGTTQGAVEVLAGGSWSMSGGILLDGPTTLNVGASATLGLNGPLSSSGPGCSVIKNGTGTLVFGGGGNNTYSGDTLVNNGALLLAKSPNVISVPGNLVIGPGPAGPATFARLYQTGGLGGMTATVNGNSLLDLNGYNAVLSQLTLNDGGSVQTEAGTLGFSSGGQVNVGSLNPRGSHQGSVIAGNLAIAPNDLINFSVGPYAIFFPFDPNPELNVPATIPRPVEQLGFAPAGITKAGAGRMRLSGNNTYAGYSQVNGGTLQVDGTQPSSPVLVNAGSTLSGAGTVGAVFLSGGTSVVRPGDHPGILNCGSFNRFGSGSGALQIELNGPGASQYDQLVASGLISLSGVTLNPSLNYASSPGDQFVILKNNSGSPVSGTFTGLAQNAQFHFGGQLFQINYSGGAGNDVVLSRLVTPPLPVLTIQELPPASVQLSWPTNAPQFQLQYISDLATNAWAPVTNPPVVVGANNVVIAPVEGLNQFYRLTAP